MLYVLDISSHFLICGVAEKVCKTLLVKVFVRMLDNIETLGNLGTRPVKDQRAI